MKNRMAKVCMDMAGSGAGSGHTTLTTLSAAEATEVDAVANLIVPGGDKPGARDARVIYFIDNAVGGFFAASGCAARRA